MLLSRRDFLAAASAASVLAVAPAFAGTTINVSLWDKPGMDMAMGLGNGMKGDMSKASMGATASQSQAKAGPVTFNVVNDSKDSVHELVVAPLKSPDAKLPYNGNLSRVLEEEAGSLGEVSELEPGQKGSLTLDLKAGYYILYCNIPGHYMAGMWTILTVK